MPFSITWCAISWAAWSTSAPRGSRQAGSPSCSRRATGQKRRRPLPPKAFISSASSTTPNGSYHNERLMRTRVKICGITRAQDARGAADAGADAIGVVFYPPSPRYLSVERAVEIRDALPPFVQTVALFVNADAAQIAQVIGRVHPAMLQFHGDETPEFCAQFGLPFVKACRVRAGVDAAAYLRPYARAAAWLLDSFVPEYGGVGERFDWSLAPRNLARPLILSGGLDAGNVGDAVRRVRPW